MKVLFDPILTIIYIPILLNTTHIYYRYQYIIYVATWLMIGPGLLCSNFVYYAFEQCSKIYPLCSKLCPSPLQLYHSSYSFIIFSDCISIVGSSLLCVISCYAAVLLYFTHYAQYYAHEKTFASFCTKLAWLLYVSQIKVVLYDQNVYKSTDIYF